MVSVPICRTTLVRLEFLGDGRGRKKFERYQLSQTDDDLNDDAAQNQSQVS
jgi:hypothetical protein